ncbi:hypothetical protein [Desulfonatronum parangueonense]
MGTKPWALQRPVWAQSDQSIHVSQGCPEEIPRNETANACEYPKSGVSPDFNSRRWSVGSCIPTLERGNDQSSIDTTLDFDFDLDSDGMRGDKVLLARGEIMA